MDDFYELFGTGIPFFGVLIPLLGVLIPFFGTSLGSAFVFFMRKKYDGQISPVLMGITSGVMMAAAIWSLLLPSIDRSEHLGRLAFVPAAGGFLGGVAFLLVLDRLIPCILSRAERSAQGGGGHQKLLMMIFAITLHNIPEGMAVGVVFSGCLSGAEEWGAPFLSSAGVPISPLVAQAFLLSLGIAIQNIPEGAIISMPLAGAGKIRRRAFACGVLSGLVEPVGAFITILLTRQIEQLLAFLLAFAAGAMVYVIVEELVPESSGRQAAGKGTIGFAVGFVLMMTLDVAFG